MADHAVNARERVAPSRGSPLRVHGIPVLLSFSSISRLSSLPFTPSHPLSLRRTFNLPPFSLLSLSPFFSFSHVRTRARARAYGLFSCFYAPLVFSLPKYNWRYDAPVSLSLSTPRVPLPHPARPGRRFLGRRGPRGAARSFRELGFGERAGRVPATR